MGQLLLFIVVALVVAAIVFGVTVMVSGGDSGLTPVEPDGKALPLPSDRPLGEEDIFRTRFDIAFRGYRMAQVDQALQRAAYDIGYKTELIGVLEAEVTALRENRTADADVLRRAREAAVAPPPDAPVSPDPVPPPPDAAVSAGDSSDPTPAAASSSPSLKAPDASSSPSKAAPSSPEGAGASSSSPEAAAGASSSPPKAAGAESGAEAGDAAASRSAERTDEEPAERR
ncbi:DivIVA domain-containing protein [Actinoplanes sp. NPDC051475]|uniref:DivIVA domain-containing protein n=1 Tax=Actinoplanes sp. NPDC051475 TaxID=3157225 RepID=UPI00345054FB